MTYDQWKTDSGYAEKTPEQENEGRCNCYYPGDCDGSCTHPPRRCDTNLVGGAGECLACDAAQGEHCKAVQS